MTVWDMTQLVMTIKSLKFNYPGMEILALKSDEVYGEIQLLEPMMENVKGFTNHGVSILGGMLCFYYTHAPSNSRETTLKLWVMKDYSVKGVLDTIIYTIQDNLSSISKSSISAYLKGLTKENIVCACSTFELGLYMVVTDSSLTLRFG
uniref:Uncharacterized protein n=1 Tax=Solanum lycopersicum TaxID=4081 RepID=A0A3Q7HZX3_SOLLC